MPEPTSKPLIAPRSRAAVLVSLGAPLAALVLALLGSASAARAQPAAPEDWPCVQVLVPEISPSVLWPVPIDPTLAGTWREDPEIQALAHRLADLERVDDEALAAMDAYAESVPETLRRGALTRLADGIVSIANTRRERYIDGIRRYTRQQIAIAEQIESTLNRLAELDDAASAESALEADAHGGGGRAAVGGGDGGAGGQSRAEIEETLAWHERLFDQRERAVRALCERPVALEESLSAVLRELSYRLPDA